MYKVSIRNTGNSEYFTATGESVIVISTNKRDQRAQVHLKDTASLSLYNRMCEDLKQSVILYTLCIKTAESLCDNNELLNILQKTCPNFINDIFEDRIKIKQINFDKLFKDLMGDNNV